MLLDKVDVCLRRDLKSKLCVPVWMGDSKVALTYDVHANQHLTASEPTQTHYYVRDEHLVRQSNIHNIHVSFIWLILHPCVKDSCLANWLQAALVDYVLRYGSAGCACIPKGIKLPKLCILELGRFDMARARQVINAAFRSHSKCGRRRHELKGHNTGMKRLCIVARPRADCLDEEGSKFVILLSLDNSFSVSSICSQYLALFNDDDLSIVLFH